MVDVNIIKLNLDPVNHIQFLTSLSEFLYYFNFNDIKIKIVS